MPLIIPNSLPAAGALQKENIFTMAEARAISQDIRPLKIVIVNLMPTKIATETQLARVLANSPIQVEMTLLRMDSHDSKNVSQAHMDSFYKTIDEIESDKYDGMILTGAPVEQMPFEDVDYWEELTGIFEFAKENVYSSFFICWGAQAALYYYYGVPKYQLPEKIFGVFEQKVKRPHNPLMRGFDETFYDPFQTYGSEEGRHKEGEETAILSRVQGGGSPHPQHRGRATNLRLGSSGVRQANLGQRVLPRRERRPSHRRAQELLCRR